MKRKQIERKKKTVFILSCIVTFLTVYSLVLPAITIDKETANEDSGIVLDNNNMNISLTEETSDKGDVSNKTDEEEVYIEERIEDVSYPSAVFSDTLNDAIIYVSAPEGAFPEGTTMSVKEVEDESIAETVSEAIENKTISSYKAIDISFYYGSSKIEPQVPIDVKITSNFISEEPQDPTLVHIDKKGNADVLETKEVKEEEVKTINDEKEVKELVENNNEIEEITVENTLSFESDSFSVYVLVYTVDFEYVDKDIIYRYSLQGGEMISLSDLIRILGVAESLNFETVDDFISLVENVEFSDPSLVLVVHPESDTTVKELLDNLGEEQQFSAILDETQIASISEKTISKNEWALISLRPFDSEESVTISLTNGEKVVVKVTDASSVPSEDGLKSLITDATITGAKLDNGSYVFYPNQPYGFHLTFKEVNKDGGQFPMEGNFTYQLPSGLMPTGSSSLGVIPITLSGGAHSGEIVNLNYTVNDSGLITFSWDTTTNPDAYNQLKENLYSQFKLDLECTYNGNGGSLDFGNGIEKDVVVKTNGKINTPNKNARYNPATNCVDYVVSVNSDGITKDVVITDTVSGSALSYKKDAVATSSIPGKEVVQPTTISSGNGFTMTVPQMADGETITIKYSAEIDLSKVTKNPDGSWGTVDETGNKVIVKSKDNPDVEKENYGKDFEHKISLSNIGKSGSNVEAGENGHATVNWTIHANDYANVSMAGHTISDSIEGNAVPVSYNGDGILVSAYYENGSAAYENKLIPWSQINKTDTSWSWTVPNQDPDNQKLSYVIKYTTDVDTTGRLINTNVKNKTESDIGGSEEKGVDVIPNGGGLSGHKKVIKTDLTGKTITWEINFDVPSTGLDSAKIVDTVPTYWEGNVLKAIDEYLDGTVTVIPELQGDEKYEVSTSTNENGSKTVTIEFFKMVDEQWVSGLSASGTTRKIRVQFQTEIDDLWVDAAKANPNNHNALYHKNTGDIILNGQTIKVEASTRIDGNEPGMSKVHGKQTIYNVDGNALPAFPYVVTISALSEDNFDDEGKLYITDTFNSKYLAWYPQTQNNNTGDNELVGFIYGATSFQDLSKGGDPIHNTAGQSSNRVVSSPKAGEVLITVDREDIPMDSNGNYYPYYYVFYYLTVKDPIALEKLEKAIQTSESGTYPLINTVTNADFGSASTTADFSIDVVDKSIIKPDGKSEKLNDYVYYENGNYMVDYKIDVNPNSFQLGDEEELTLTDDYTNLAVDYTTIRIQKEDNGQFVDTTEADGVSWNRKGNRVTYTLKNGVHYLITYSARITGEPDNSGKVNYTNTVEFFGVKDWEDHTQDIKSSGEGNSPTYGITVFKHVKGSGSSPLQGAIFDLYRYGDQGTEDSWQNQPEASTTDHTGWTKVESLTTDEKGVAKNTNSLAKWTWYKLIETQAPTVNGQEYQKKDFAYVFWITDSGKADYAHYVYLNDDVVAIDNEPVLPETVDLGVKKAWTNDSGDISKRTDITIHLYADGVPYADWKDKNGNSLPARDDTVKTLKLKEDGTTEEYVWSKLSSGPIYSVVEDLVPGYTTTYSSKGTQISGNITITNKYIPGKTYIHIEKFWKNVNSEDLPEDITVQLKRRVIANTEVRIVSNTGTMREHFSVPANSVVNIEFAGRVPEKYEYRGAPYTEENNWQGELYVGYRNGTRPAWELYKGDRVDSSALLDSGTSENGVSTEHGHEVHIDGINVGQYGLTIRFPDDYGQGQYDPNLGLSMTPKVTVIESGSSKYSEDENYNNENHYYTFGISENWKLDIDRLIKEDDDGKYIYYIEEVGVNDNTQTPKEAGFAVKYENNEGIAGGTGDVNKDTIKVTNTKDSLGKVAVSKAFEGINSLPDDLPDDFCIKNNYNNDIFTVNNKSRGSGTAEDPYIWIIEDVPAGTEVTFIESGINIDGYSVSITANGKSIDAQGVSLSAKATSSKVSEGEKIPTATFVNKYEKPKTGSLKIEKNVLVNEEGTSKTTADGTYHFTIKNKNESSSLKFVYDSTAKKYKLSTDSDAKELIPIVVLNGKVNTVEVVDLPEGTYVVSEILTEEQKAKGIELFKSEGSEVTISADASSVPTAKFTNNIDLTELSVRKIWGETSPADHPKQIGFKVYRVGYYLDKENKQKPAVEGFYPDENTIYTVEDGKSFTVSDLPVSGKMTINGIERQVSYIYTVVEQTVQGDTLYWQNYAYDQTDTGIKVDITNTPIEKSPHETNLEISKIWLDKDNQDAAAKHQDDKIKFKLKQIPYITNYVPVKIVYINADGTTWKNQEVFVEKGSNLVFNFAKGNTVFRHYVEITSNSQSTQVGGRGEEFEYQTGPINDASTFTVHLLFSFREIRFFEDPIMHYDMWGDSVKDLGYSYQWTSSLSSSSTSSLYTDFDTFYNAMVGGVIPDASNDGIYTLGKANIEKISGAFDGEHTKDWEASFLHLPMLAKVGDKHVVYTYEIDEIEILPKDGETEIVKEISSSDYNGETANYLVRISNQGTSWEISNTEKAGIDIDIKKVDNANNPIGGAVFELYRMNSKSVFEKLTSNEYEWLDSNDQFTINEEGFTMLGLTDGTYQIKEIVSPAGFVITNENPVKFTISDRSIVDGLNELTNGVTYEPASESGGLKNPLYTIPNSPGAALPSTGGSGIKGYRILGAVLILVSGLLSSIKQKAR